MRISVRKTAFAAVIAAVYAALTLSTASIAYGPVQFLIAEALCVLPFFFPFSVWGLFVGCVLSNIISAYGLLDVVVGSLATLFAARCTMMLGRRGKRSVRRYALACLPPVLFNAVMVGAVIALYGASDGAFVPMFLVNAAQVAFGEAAVMYVIGLPLMIYLPRTRLFGELQIGER